ncbi:MAG: hypothetical protein OXQ94_13415 [Gemmatimonadota bacterium]|nr:hypothetical protein [Gemmatimonadota bacterium]MDE2872673.1 hypothetical protein [Gemmatimonadota bacterium]
MHRSASAGIHQGGAHDEVEVLSRIIAELNERFGIELGPEHRVTLQQMMDRLEENRALDAAAHVGIECDRLDNDDKFMLHLVQVVRWGIGRGRVWTRRPRSWTGGRCAW